MRRPLVRFASVPMSLLLALLGAGFAVLLAASPASASCAAAPTVEQGLSTSDLVFVGTVKTLTNRGRWPTFQLEQLWKGTPGTNRIEVHAGPADPPGPNEVATSVDRTYELGVRYLVMARDPEAAGFQRLYGSSNRYEDNICSATRPYATALDCFRPKSHLPLPAAPEAPVAAPVTTARGSNDPTRLVAAVLAGALVTAAAALVIVRRRRASAA